MTCLKQDGCKGIVTSLDPLQLQALNSLLSQRTVMTQVTTDFLMEQSIWFKPKLTAWIEYLEQTESGRLRRSRLIRRFNEVKAV